MATVDVRCESTQSGWSCTVTVEDGDGHPTTHAVGVTADAFRRLGSPDSGPEDLVRRSFEFLLERESKESILRRFDLAVIGRYFPEYERTIRR